MNKSQKMLEKGSFWELLLKLALPSVIVILVMIIYNMADTYFIGQTGDPNKISSISLALPIFTILSGIGTLFGNGGSTSISIALGEGNHHKIKQIATFCFFGCMAVGLVFFLGIFIFTRPLANLLGADADTLEGTMTYLRVFCFASPFVMYSQVMGSVMRADGDAAIGMLSNLTGTISNIVMDALFILVFHWDVFGAAFASVLGNVLSSILVMIIILKRKPDLIPDFKSDFMHADIAIPVLTLGLPMMFSTLLSSVTHTLSNRLMMGHGSIYLAAQSVSGKFNMVITMLIMGICIGMQPAISYRYGAKDYKGMYSVVKSTGLFAIVIGTVLTALVYVFRGPVVAAFIDNAEVISIGQIFVLAAVVVGPFYAIYQMCITFLQSTGKVNYSIFTSLLDKGLVFVPVLLIMNYLFGAYGIAFAHAVTMIFSLAVALILAFKWASDIKKNAAEISAETEAALDK